MRKKSVLEARDVTLPLMATHKDLLDALYIQLPAITHDPVQGILSRVLFLVWDMPASAAHHHRQRWGLWTHSLEVVVAALQQATQTQEWRHGAQTIGGAERARAQYLIAVVAAAVLHDVAKVHDCAIRCEDPVTKVPHVWDVWEMFQLDWLLKWQYRGVIPETSITWHAGRGVAHASHTLPLAHMILPESVTRTLGHYLAESLWMYLINPDQPGTIFYPLLKGMAGADAQSVAQAPEAVTVDWAVIWLKTLFELCRTGGCRVNLFPGQVFVMEEMTYVVIENVSQLIREYLSKQRMVLPADSQIFGLLAAANYFQEGYATKMPFDVTDVTGRRETPAQLRLVAFQNTQLHRVAETCRVPDMPLPWDDLPVQVYGAAVVPREKKE